LHIAAEFEVTPGHGIIGGVEWRVNVRLNLVSYSFNFPNVPGTYNSTNVGVIEFHRKSNCLIVFLHIEPEI
jgi:hypothetical protein